MLSFLQYPLSKKKIPLRGAQDSPSKGFQHLLPMQTNNKLPKTSLKKDAKKPTANQQSPFAPSNSETHLLAKPMGSFRIKYPAEPPQKCALKHMFNKTRWRITYIERLKL